MMTSIDTSLIAVMCAVAGLIAALFALVGQWKQRAGHRRDLTALRRSIEKQEMAFLEMFSGVHRSVAMLEEGLSGLREAPRPGALSRSARAQALQLLRSGLSAESAAVTLGVGRREMRLLEQVSRTLCGR